MPRDFLFGLLLAACAALVGFADARAAGYRALYEFKGGSDGAVPESSLIEDGAGNLYGTTIYGGSANCGGLGCGTVFKLGPKRKLTILYAFTGDTDGQWPRDGLTIDDSGNLYSTTQNGGKFGFGTVFRVSPDGKKSTLYDFRGGNDGEFPFGRLHRDATGNLYGTTQIGGGNGCADGFGCGTVFKLAPDGTETILHAFSDASDGYTPVGLIADKAGNLFGVTSSGGDTSCPGSGNFGCGTIFELAEDGTKSTLYTFKGGADGMSPTGLVRDKTGNLYGTTVLGGTVTCENRGGCGTVFRLAPDGTKTTLYSFKSGDDGDDPEDRLARDSAGNFYGVTVQGGGIGHYGHGTIFKIGVDGGETVLRSFKVLHGDVPFYGVRIDHNGDLVGTTSAGGVGQCGTTKRGHEVGCGVIYRFTLN
jgi:uncharacterized repeat protein (TIGR03803 family)